MTNSKIDEVMSEINFWVNQLDNATKLATHKKSSYLLEVRSRMHYWLDQLVVVVKRETEK